MQVSYFELLYFPFPHTCLFSIIPLSRLRKRKRNEIRGKKQIQTMNALGRSWLDSCTPRKLPESGAEA
jgi:hypothetical protein